jgi:DNA-binding IclR family transcriptional regulator
MAGRDGSRGAPQVQSVDRALAVLDLLATAGELGVTDLAAQLGVHRSTAFRLVSALESRDLVEQISDRGKYRLGVGILRLAAATTSRLELTREGREICERLARDAGETVHVAILDGDAAVNVLQELGGSSVTTQDWIGRRTPLHATSSGKVLLAWAPEAVLTGLLARPLEACTDRTRTDPAALAEELATVRVTGWGATEEELEPGLNGVSAPVRDSSGKVVGALSVSGPSYRLTRDERPALVSLLLDAAKEISTRLGSAG